MSDEELSDHKDSIFNIPSRTVFFPFRSTLAYLSQGQVEQRQFPVYIESADAHTSVDILLLSQFVSEW